MTEPPRGGLAVGRVLRLAALILTADAAAILGLGLPLVFLPVLLEGLPPRGGDLETAAAVIAGLSIALYVASICYGVISRLNGDALPSREFAGHGVVASPRAYSVTLFQATVLVACAIGALAAPLAMPALAPLALPLAVTVGFALLVVTLPAAPAALIERLPVARALARAAALTRGRRAHVGLLVLAVLLTLLPFGLVVRELSANAGGAAGAWLRAAFAWGATALVAVVPPIVYWELRLRP